LTFHRRCEYRQFPTDIPSKFVSLRGHPAQEVRAVDQVDYYSAFRTRNAAKLAHIAAALIKATELMTLRVWHDGLLIACPETNTIFPVTYSRFLTSLKCSACPPYTHKAILCYIIYKVVWERRGQMLKRPQIAGTFAFKCALLFLATAIFTWGLQAKLSLYKPPKSPSTVTVAKLLTERRSAQTIDSLKMAVQSDTAWETLNLIPLLILAQGICFLTFRFYQAETNLCRSRRWHFQDRHLTQRPPPAF